MISDHQIFDALTFMVSPPEDSLLYVGIYDPFWVAISILLSIIASYAALEATSRIEQQKHKVTKLIWTLIGAFTMGIGVWAMHFIGMMALSLPCGIYYDPLITLISMIPGILASGVALGVVWNHGTKHLSPFLASILLGAGIGTMHYTGMAAIRLEGFIRYSPTLFALSIIVAIGLSYLALKMKSGMVVISKQQKMLLAVIMGFAVSGMHYTAMYAAYFVKGDISVLPSSLFTTNTLASLISITTIILALAALASAAISRNREMTDELRQNEKQFRSVIEAIPDAILLKDGESHCLVANESARKIYQLLNLPWVCRTDTELAQLNSEFRTAHDSALKNDAMAWQARELTLSSESVPSEFGEMCDFEVRRVPVFNNQGERQSLVVIGRDVTERKKVEASLILSASVFANASEAIMITSYDGTILEINGAFTNITKYSRDEVVGKNPRILSSGRHTKEFFTVMWGQLIEQGFFYGEIWNRRKNGDIYPVMQTISAVRGEQGDLLHYVALFSDVSDSRQAEEEIHYLASYDTLTKLANRRSLMDRLNLALSASVQSCNYGVLMMLDMDNFKNINDTLGLEYGDLLLIEVAERIKMCVRDVDTVARVGGDEFVVLIENVDMLAEVASQKIAVIAEKIRTTLAEPYHLKGNQYLSSPSIGVILYRGLEISADNLLKQADTAMYQAKDAGRNAIRFFDIAMQSAVEARAALESDLRNALPAQQLHLYYQVQVDDNRHPIGAEALIRWIHPTRGMVSPAQFIPIAEENSLIVSIGTWVLDTACIQLAEWSKNEQTRHLTLAVNVSARQFKQHDFVEKVATILDMHGVEASLLKIELTESVVLNDIADVVSKMHALMSLGVKLSMDDFGTGYSSLSYLKQMPLDQLKIDQSFVRDMMSDQNDAVMVKTIIDLAKNFRLNIIAEGVETEAQLSLLQQMGCMSYQGYLFSKPVPIKQFEALLNKSPP